jgi:hypothetical protein
MTVVCKLILGEAPAIHLCENVFRHPRIIGQEIHQSLLVKLVLFDDFTAALIGSIRVIVVPPDIVGAERAMIVGIGLTVRNSVELLKDFPPPGLENPQQQFVLLIQASIAS